MSIWSDLPTTYFPLKHTQRKMSNGAINGHANGNGNGNGHVSAVPQMKSYEEDRNTKSQDV